MKLNEPTALRQLASANAALHRIGHDAGGIVLASRIRNKGKPDRDVRLSYELLQRLVKANDAGLALAQASLDSVRQVGGQPFRQKDDTATS